MKFKVMMGVTALAMLALAGCASSPESTSSPAPSAKTSKELTAKDIVARHRNAVYGEAKTRKHSSTTSKGILSIEQFGIDAPVTIYAAAPNSSSTTLEVMGMTLNNGCHKGVCWAQQPGAGTTVLSGDTAEFQAQQADYNQFDNWGRYYPSLEILVGADGPNHKIKATRKNGDADIYEFSKETGLIVSAVMQAATPQGKMEVSMQFKNYKIFDGEMIATEIDQITPQATIKIVLKEVSFAPIPEEKFAKPN